MTRNQEIARFVREKYGIEATPDEVGESTDGFLSRLKKELDKRDIEYPKEDEELLQKVASFLPGEQWNELFLKSMTGEAPDPVPIIVKMFEGTFKEEDLEYFKEKGIVENFVEKICPVVPVEIAQRCLASLKSEEVCGILTRLGFRIPEEDEEFAEMVMSIMMAGAFLRGMLLELVRNEKQD